MSVATEFEPMVDIPERRPAHSDAAPLPARRPAAADRSGWRRSTTLHRPPAEAVAPPLRLTRRGVARRRGGRRGARARAGAGRAGVGARSAPSADRAPRARHGDRAGGRHAVVDRRRGWRPQRDPRAEVADLQRLNHLGRRGARPGPGAAHALIGVRLRLGSAGCGAKSSRRAGCVALAEHWCAFYGSPLHVVVTPMYFVHKLGLAVHSASPSSSTTESAASSTGSSPAAVDNPVAARRLDLKERDRREVSVLPAPRLPRGRLARAGRGPGHPAPPLLPGVRQAVHHGRRGDARRHQAQRRHRAVQPAEGRQRRPPGLPGSAGRRGRAGPARADASRRRSGRPVSPRCPATRSAWPSSARCASSTRSPTCASPRVYQAFSSIDDFEKAITDLRAEHRTRTRPPAGDTDAAHRSRPTAASTARPPASPAAPPGRTTDDRGRRQAPRHATSAAADRPVPRRPSPVVPARTACAVERVYTTAGRAPLRRGHLGAARRRHDQLARRLDQLRAARRRVPRLLVGQRGQHRHHQVLPRRGRHRGARVVAAASSSTGSCTSTARPGERARLLRLRRRRRDLRARADLDAAAPGVQLQLAGLVQRRHHLAAAGQRLLHPGRRRHDGLDPELVPRGGPDLQGRLRRRA